MKTPNFVLLGSFLHTTEYFEFIDTIWERPTWLDTSKKVPEALLEARAEILPSWGIPEVVEQGPFVADRMNQLQRRNVVNEE